MKKSDFKKLKCWYLEIYNDYEGEPYIGQTKTLRTYNQCKKLRDDFEIDTEGYHIDIMFMDFDGLYQEERYLDMTIDECKEIVNDEESEYEVLTDIFEE